MYWDKMLIVREEEKGRDVKGDELIISQQRPSFFAAEKIPKFLSVICLDDESLTLNEKTLQKVSDFYTKNNLMLSGNMNRVKPLDLMKFINLDAELVLIKFRQKIIGSMLSILFPIRIACVFSEGELININSDNRVNTSQKSIRHENIVGKEREDFVFANATFLNNHKKWRGKGLGMVLIQKSLQIAYDQSILCAYFLNTKPRCSNAVTIKNWIYPINPDRLDKLHIDYPRKYRSTYTFSLPTNHSLILVNENNAQEALDSYLELVKNKKFYFNPNISYWRKWIVNHNTYMLKIDTKFVGIFCTNKITTYIPSKKCELEHGNILFCVGKQPETLMSLLFQCRQNGYDMLMLQEYGDLNKYLLTNILAINTGTSDYLNFYNTRIRINPEDIYAPLL